jgi:BT1 family
VVLSVAATVLAAPTIGMFYGLHEWSAARTGGWVDARTIALINTALESPLGQIAMIPMLAWIANSAPANLKATYFAVMASFSNLALAASQLGTTYLNRVFLVKRGDYSELGELMLVAAALGLLLPLAAVAGVRLSRLRTA